MPATEGWFFDFNKLWGGCVMRRAPGHHLREEEQEEGGPSGKRAARASLWFVSQFQYVFFCVLSS